MLTLEGIPLIKCWLHLAKGAQRKLLKKLKKDPQRRWLVSDTAWEFFERYDEFRQVSETAIRLTSTGAAPWHVVEATDARHRNLTVTTTLARALREALEEESTREARRKSTRKPALPKPTATNLIRQLDLTAKLEDDEYDRLLVRHQGRLSRSIRRLPGEGRSLILVFEGPDAAGKGGAIRRLTAAMDARLYRVISIGAPTDEEATHPYLWRFWRGLPRHGRVTIYDRSWYGRVLVERLEGFARRDEWQRAFGEINEFESQLVESGIILLKFWLAISPEEQLKRFKDRQTTPYKQYKLTEEDWRNRKKWDAYEAAAVDMIARTSTDDAPWTLVEADDKRWARVKVLKTVTKTLKKELD
jgi:polyphosphate:AMP phosphotransferase